MNSRELDPVTEQAIAWMVRLRSGQASSRQQARFQGWLQADPAHAQAWSQLNDSLGQHYEVVRRAPPSLRETLLHTDPKRRHVLRLLAGCSLLGGGFWLAARSPAGLAMRAELQTATAERRHLTLPDGSQLALNARSAADIDFNHGQRLLSVHRGSLVVQVAADPLRPFIVRSAQGEVRALGTRFLVEQLAHATRVVVLEHSVQLSLAQGRHMTLQEGQGALLHAQRIEALDGNQRYRADWLDGRLSVLDDTLEQVIDALRAYHRGLIRVSPALRELRVQGVFSLDQSQRSLEALAETLPIQITHYGPWLTLLQPEK